MERSKKEYLLSIDGGIAASGPHFAQRALAAALTLLPAFL
jgi:hypothetical protein